MLLCTLAFAAFPFLGGVDVLEVSERRMARRKLRVKSGGAAIVLARGDAHRCVTPWLNSEGANDFASLRALHRPLRCLAP